MFTVGVKFCGNCNPQIDSQKLLQEIEGRLEKIKFVGWEKEKDALLMINGCPVGCATRPDFEGATVFIAGKTVNGKAVEFEELVDYASRALKELARQKSPDPKRVFAPEC